MNVRVGSHSVHPQAGWLKIFWGMLFLLQIAWAPAAQAAGWTSAGSMSAERKWHTATLLPNGKVLVVGGYGSSGSSHYVTASELYDPVTNTWTSVGNMSFARFSHTATLLPDGRVLIAGGEGKNGVYITKLSSTEIYDPATNAWSNASNMIGARYAHTATLLPNGKVLVAGGQDNSQFLSSAEIYDPATNTWLSADNMLTAHYGHTATLLSNGKVLIAGGLGSGVQSSAEVFDASTGKWTLVSSMSHARAYHSATLLPNAKVLVAGGLGGDCLKSVELYDPLLDSWTNASDLSVVRYDHTATLLSNGEVLVAGGSTGYANTSVGCSKGVNVTSIAEIYEPDTDKWASAGNMLVGRSGHSGTLLPNGKALVTGGATDSSYLSSAELSLSAGVVPGPPTVLRIVPGNTWLRIFFSPPAYSGGSEINSYTVSCSGSGVATRTATGASSPITVTGLTNGVSYTCTVSATNSAGTGAASVGVTKVVKPVSIAPILPIILD